MYSPGGGYSHDLEHQAITARLRGYSPAGTWANRPTNPAVGDSYAPTDRKYIFTWDGTRWMSQPIHLDFGWDNPKPINTAAAAGVLVSVGRVDFGELGLISGNGGVIVDTVHYFVFDNVINNTVSYFDWAWVYGNSAGGVSGGLPIPGAVNSQGQAAGTWGSYQLLTGAAPQVILDGAFCYLQIQVVTRGTAPVAHAIYPNASASLRIIG